MVGRDGSASSSRRDAAITRRWVERLERVAAGNHTVLAFCAAEDNSPSNFFLWRQRLAQPSPPPAVRTPTAVPIRVTPPPTPATPIELALPAGSRPSGKAGRAATCSRCGAD